MTRGSWVLVALALAACDRVERPTGLEARARIPPAPATLDAAAAAELDRLEGAVKAAPGDHEAADRYREAARAHGATRRAVNWFERLAADGNAGREANVHYQLGMAYVDLMSRSSDLSKPALTARTIASFDAALARDPGLWDARYAKGLVYLRMPAGFKQYPEAIEVFSDLLTRQAALPAKPEFALTYARLSEAYMQGGNPQRADAILRSGLRRFPDHPLLRHSLAAMQQGEQRP